MPSGDWEMVPRRRPADGIDGFAIEAGPVVTMLAYHFSTSPLPLSEWGMNRQSDA